jgi:hypothetical protein
VWPFREEMQKLGVDATRRPRARVIIRGLQGREREYAMGPGRHIYRRADVAQFRGVDTHHSCNAKCDAPSAFAKPTARQAVWVLVRRGSTITERPSLA